MPETLSQGVTIPVGADAISSSGVDAMRTLGTTVNTALGAKVSATRIDPVDLNTVKNPGFYVLPAPYPTGYTNYPADNNTASIMQVGGSIGGTWAFQEIVQYGQNQRRFWRMSRTQTTWNDWVEIAPPTASSVPVNALATGGREMRVRMFEEAYPLVSTGNKAVVVFRYDHGLTNFKNVLKPIHDTYNVKAYIAMNSRLWDIAENSGATQAEAKAWANVEWGNHTSDHIDRADIAGIHDTILNGRLELESQLARTIHGFTVPGVTEFNKFEGFGTGDATGYSSTYAGNLIMNQHAVCSGTISAPGTPVAAQRTLDGVNRIGGRHYTWESSDYASIKAQIDSAISNKRALTLMCHPRTMGNSGYWNATLADQVIGYVRSQIDAGNLADISYYQSHRATL